MLKISTNWQEPVVISSIVYLFLFIFHKFFSKNQTKKKIPFDYVFFFMLSGTLMSAINGNEKGIVSAIISAATLIFLNTSINILTKRNKALQLLIEGKPEVLILNGRIHNKVLKRLNVSSEELSEALREHELLDPQDVKCAIRETDGTISVIKYIH